MELVSVIGLAVIAAVICTLLKQFYPEYAAATAILCGTVILLFVCGAADPIIEVFAALSDTAGLDQTYLIAAIKMLGLCWITALGADICRDMGQGALASKVELAGRVAVLIAILPFVNDLLVLAKDLIGINLV